MDKKPISVNDLISHHVRSHYTPFYAWIRHVVTLSSGTLTVLVALQNHNVPKDPQHLYLLQFCWLFLVLSILFGVVALRGEWQTPLDVAQKIQDDLVTQGEDRTKENLILSPDHEPRRIFSFSRDVVFPLYALALFLLVSFSILNLGVIESCLNV